MSLLRQGTTRPVAFLECTGTEYSNLAIHVAALRIVRVPVPVPVHEAQKRQRGSCTGTGTGTRTTQRRSRTGTGKKG